MFTTLTGAALYILALFPGVAFVSAREGHSPVGKRSPLRELAQIVLVSAFCCVVIALLLLLVSIWAPWLRAAIDSLVSANTKYLSEHYQGVFLISVISIALATGLGWWLGGPRAAHLGVNRILRSKIDRDSSGWGKAFGLVTAGKNEPRVIVHVGAQLKSGAWLQGQLHDFNNAGDDEERAIVLVGSLKYRPTGTSELLEVADYGTIVLSSGAVEYLFVGYQDEMTSTEVIEAGD